MPTILEAIEAGNGAGGDSITDIADEIRDIYSVLPEDVQTKIDIDISKAADAAKMSRILNGVRAKIQRENQNV